LLVALVAVPWVALDQLTKWWALRELRDGPIELVWTLRLKLAFNSGTAFGRGQGFGPLIAVVAIVVVVALVLASRRTRSPLTLVATGLVLGGAVGNVVDRVARDGDGFLGGAVVDFIDLQWWPVFNVADMGIVVGGIWLFLSQLRPEEGGEAR
jgi:signal peptidase II